MSSIGALALATETRSANVNTSSTSTTNASFITDASAFRQNLTDAVRSLGTQTRTAADASTGGSASRNDSATRTQSGNSYVRSSSASTSSEKTASSFDNQSSSSGRNAVADKSEYRQTANNRTAQNPQNKDQSPTTSAGENTSDGYSSAPAASANTEDAADTTQTDDVVDLPPDDTNDNGDDTQGSPDAATMLMMMPLTQLMNPQQQEALSRITALTTSGVLDGNVLEQLPDEEINALADWALAGAGGLLPEYDGTAATSLAGFSELNQPLGSESLDALSGLDQTGSLSPDQLWSFLQNPGPEEGTLADFGLNRAAQAITRLQTLQQTLNNTGSLGDSLAALSNSQPFSEMSLDRIAQSVSSGLAVAAQDAGLETESLSLPDLLNALPEDQVTQILNHALTEEGATQELPELPEAVVRSLSVQLVSVDAGGNAQNSAQDLLNNLDRNQGLRQALLQQMTMQNVRQGESAGTESLPELPVSAEGIGQEVAQTPVVATGSGAEVPAPKVATAPAATAATPEAAVNAAAENATPVWDSAMPAAAAEEEPVEPLSATATKTTVAAESIPEQAAAATEEVVDPRPVSKESAPAAADQSAPAEDAESATASASTNIEGDTQQKDQGNSDESLHQESARLSAERKQDTTASSAEFQLPVTIAAGDGIRPASSGLDRASFGDFGVTGASLATPQAAGQATGSTSTTGAVSYSQMSENIDRLQRILQSASSGSDLKSITMQLNPEELGKVTINVELRDGTVHATIKTENESARDMLLNGGDQLRRNLEANGIKLDSFDVSVNKEGYDQPDGRNQAGWQAAQEEQQKRFQGQNRPAAGNAATGTSDKVAEQNDGSSDDNPGVLPGGALNVVA